MPLQPQKPMMKPSTGRLCKQREESRCKKKQRDFSTLFFVNAVDFAFQEIRFSRESAVRVSFVKK